ncbi:class I SAM-dependent methyltransferase [Paenibacillus humicola]|uniref:class I SAM-dependent methyltransferase n=1 Tax=Paenibacillus humicola TaxID=3110540 RepID=UPI00237A7C94|nr:class I SAM-dependent methyltransferase [Paenibacillus humicola]
MSAWFNRYYDTLMKPLENGSFRSIRTHLLERASGRVLEIGSGTGINFPYYRFAESVSAIEPDEGMLQASLVRAQRSAVPIEVRQGSAERLPFPTDAFDTVVGTLVFCTIPDPATALSEIRRVCKPGGGMLLFEHVKLQHPVWGRMQEWLTPGWSRLCGGCRLNRDTLAAVRLAGFRIARIEWKMKGLFIIVEAVNDK